VEAVTLADQVVVMRSGKVEQIGSYQDLTELPATTFVAGFIGFPPMNLFPGGRVINSGLSFEHLQIPLPQRILGLVSEGQALTLGIRPEAIALNAGDGSVNGIRLTGNIESVEPDFGRHILQVRIRTGEWTYSASCSTETNYSIGDSVIACLDPERLHFFDTLSGLRL
jgi:multiple sugar transport system ATP-binding protein